MTEANVDRHRKPFGRFRRQSHERVTELPPTEIIHLPESAWTLTARPTISVTDITAGVLPDSRVRDAKDLFVKNAKAPFTVFTVTKEGSDEQEYLVVGPSTTAHETNAMLHHAAPSKAFGLNTNDILQDWNALYNGNNEGLRTAHTTMPGWEKYFEPEKDRVLGIISRNYREYSYEQQDETDLLVPLLRFKRGENGMQIILDPPDDDMLKAINAAIPNQVIDNEHASSGMGLMFLTAYSPDNAVWPQVSGYHDVNATKNNIINATQVFAFAYGKVTKAQRGDPTLPHEDIQQSSLLSAIADYADTGIVTPVKIMGKTEKELLNDEKRRKGRQSFVRRSGNVLLTAGAATIISGMGATIYHSNSIEKLDTKYATIAPLVPEVDQADGAYMVLLDLSRQHPELAPLTERKMEEEKKVMRDYKMKMDKKEAEKHSLTESQEIDFGILAGGVTLGFLGARLRRRYPT